MEAFFSIDRAEAIFLFSGFVILGFIIGLAL